MTERRQGTGTGGWIVVALLFAAGCVNYLDRSALSIANHDIAGELHLSPAEMGALLSVFAWAYALLQLPVGALADRFGPRLTLLFGMLAWSAAQIGSGAVRTFGQFLAARAALGMGEAPMFTSGARAIVDHFPPPARGVPLGFFNAASSLAPAIAPPLLTGLMLAFGWRPMFVALGVAGLAVALAWGALYRPPAGGTSPRSREADAPAAHASWRALLATPTTWALVGGQFGIVYVTWLAVSWLPAYLEDARHVTVAATGWLAAIPQAAGFAGACGGGLLSDWLVRRGLDPTAARRRPTALGLVAAAACVALTPLLPGTPAALASMSLALFAAYGASSTSWALGATLAPPGAVATLEAIQNVGGSVGGALAPLVTGLIVERTGSFTAAFELAALVALLSAACIEFVRRDAYGR